MSSSKQRRLYADKKLQLVYSKVAAEFGLPPAYIEEVFKSQFGLTKEVIESGTFGDKASFKNIMHLHLGKFVVKDFKFKIINERYVKKNRLQ
jgi:AraC-like DNA-binding protein